MTHAGLPPPQIPLLYCIDIEGKPTKIFKNYFSTTRLNVTRTSVLASLVGRSRQKTLCGVIDNLKRQFHENIDTVFFQGWAPHSFPF